jgi:hypothetical protein
LKPSGRQSAFATGSIAQAIIDVPAAMPHLVAGLPISLLGPRKFPARRAEIPCSVRREFGLARLILPCHPTRKSPPGGPDFENSLLISLFSGNSPLAQPAAR